MYRLELKRLIKSRSTLFLAAAMLAMSVFFACVTVAGAGSVESRGYIALRGMEAINYQHELYAEVEGYVTPERLAEMSDYSVWARDTYGRAENMPRDVYERWLSYEPILSGSCGRISCEAQEYYEARRAALAKFAPTQAALASALALNERVDEPFYWEYGFGESETGVNWTLCLFALCLICAVIAVPTFSQGYSSGADGILRCAKLGRGKLARAKILAAYSVCSALFLLSAALFCAIILLTFGPDGSSAQLKLGPFVLLDISMTGVLALCVLSGLLMMLASVSFTLWLSSLLSNGVSVLVLSAAMLAMPSFVNAYMSYPADDWVRLLLPTGGTGLQIGMYNELAAYSFLTLGPIAVWTPFAALAVPALEAPVFALLARRAYVRHECA